VSFITNNYSEIMTFKHYIPFFFSVDILFITLRESKRKKKWNKNENSLLAKGHLHNNKDYFQQVPFE